MSKVFLVTGASRGIGSAIVEKLCIYPDILVVGVARNEKALQALKEKHGSRFDYVAGNVADEKVTEQLVQRVQDRYGRLDAVIANAGVLEPVQDVNNIDVTAWKELFDVNFFSVVMLVQKTLPLLKSSSGQLVFVSSGASVKSYHGWGAYGASKAALNHFAATIAEEEKRVSVISVAPGVVDTQMQNDIRTKFASAMSPESVKKFADLKSNNELLQPEVPATIYANLAYRGIPKALNGKYVRYNDEKLSEYTA